jgi:hypothetical protein
MILASEKEFPSAVVMMRAAGDPKNTMRSPVLAARGTTVFASSRKGPLRTCNGVSTTHRRAGAIPFPFVGPGAVLRHPLEKIRAQPVHRRNFLRSFSGLRTIMSMADRYAAWRTDPARRSGRDKNHVRTGNRNAWFVSLLFRTGLVSEYRRQHHCPPLERHHGTQHRRTSGGQ